MKQQLLTLMVSLNIEYGQTTTELSKIEFLLITDMLCRTTKGFR